MEWERVKGLIINKFRGDSTILDPGIQMLTERGQVPVLGTVPYMELTLEDEDSLTDRFDVKRVGKIDLAVIHYPRISNFTDFDVFEQMPEVSVRYVTNVRELGTPDLIFLPGSKNTMGDLKWMRQNGLEAAIKRAAGKVPIFGICGGYQMLGCEIADPDSVEEGGQIRGMELLPVRTVLQKEKHRCQTDGTLDAVEGIFSGLTGCEFTGYEIHMGQTVYCNRDGSGAKGTMILSSSAYRFTYGDYLQDVSDVFDKTDLNKDDFIQSYLDYCSDGDKTYFVPFQVVGYYMYWNKDLFKKAGLDPETPPTSWDEWQQDAAKISDSTKNIYGSGISYDYAYQIAHIMQRFGGLAVTDDNGTWKANFENNAGYENFLNMYKDMVDDGDNPLEADTDSMMSAGQVGITVGGPWVTAGLDTAGVDYGIGLIPQGDAGDMNSVEVIGFGITTAASDAEKEAAYKFIKWWNTQDKDGSSPALEWSLQNGFPAYTYSVQNNKEYKANKKLSAMSAANPEAPTDFIVDSNFPGINSVLSDVIPEMINSVAFGNSSVEDALAKAQKSTQKIVDKYNK